MNWREILEALDEGVIGVDVGISTRIFTPLATWFRDNLGINQWTLAVQSLIASGLSAVIYFGGLVHQSSWYGFIGGFVPFGFAFSEYPKIKFFSKSNTGPFLALIRDRFLRIMLLGGTLGIIVGSFINPISTWDYLGIAYLSLFLTSCYFRTVILPPPPPPRTSENLIPAYA